MKLIVFFYFFSSLFLCLVNSRATEVGDLVLYRWNSFLYPAIVESFSADGRVVLHECFHPSNYGTVINSQGFVTVTKDNIISQVPSFQTDKQSYSEGDLIVAYRSRRRVAPLVKEALAIFENGKALVVFDDFDTQLLFKARLYKTACLLPRVIAYSVATLN